MYMLLLTVLSDSHNSMAKFRRVLNRMQDEQKQNNFNLYEAVNDLTNRLKSIEQEDQVRGQRSLLSSKHVCLSLSKWNTSFQELSLVTQEIIRNLREKVQELKTVIPDSVIDRVRFSSLLHFIPCSLFDCIGCF